MPALTENGHTARVIWLGRVGDRDEGLESEAVKEISLGFGGMEGDSHGGIMRAACSRVRALYQAGTQIRNTRQLSIVSTEELALISTAMGLERLDPGLIGASMVLEGLPDLSHLPPASRLLAPSGACLVVDMENRPCALPARPIESKHPGFGSRFKRAAAGRRGITAWVEAEGRIASGDLLRLFIPDQPVWAGQRSTS